MKVVIIENEELSQEKLMTLLNHIDSDIEILATLDSVEESIRWFSTEEKDHVDLIFVDVELDDGLSFQIFECVEIDIPIVFVTAYDKYAIRALKINSLDYLLKPIQKDDLTTCLMKFYKSKNLSMNLMTYKMQEVGEIIKNKYKKRFMSKFGETYVFTPIDQIAYFSLDLAGTFLMTWNNKKHFIEHNLDTLENVLDPTKFFRLNRSFICNIDAISQVIKYSNRRLKIVINNYDGKDIIMSREKVTAFKEWLDV